MWFISKIRSSWLVILCQLVLIIGGEYIPAFIRSILILIAKKWISYQFDWRLRDDHGLFDIA